jgi:hypothetical protein
MYHNARSSECQISLLNLLRDKRFSAESLEYTDCLWAVWGVYFLTYIKNQTQHVERMRHMYDNPRTSHVRKLPAAHPFTYEMFWERSDASTLFSFFVINERKHWMFLYISSCQYGQTSTGLLCVYCSATHVAAHEPKLGGSLCHQTVSVIMSC